MALAFSEALSRQPIRTFSILTFAICMLVLVADGMDAQLLGIVAPVVIEEFGVDRGTFGIAMSSALVGFGIGSWGGGWLGDTVGRRWSLALASLVFALGTVGASTTSDVWAMAAWRLVSGLGFGSAYANAIALAGEWLPDKWRSVGVTTLSVGTPAGGLVVASLAPTLLDTYGWRGTFVAVGLSTLIVVVLIVAILRDSPSFLLSRGKPDEAKIAARKVLDGDPPLAPERHMTDTAAGAIGVLDASNARLNLGIGIAFAAATMVAYGMLNWGTTFLTAKGLTLDVAAYTVAVGGITSMIASIAVGVVIQRLGSQRVVLTLSAGLFITLLVFTVVLESLPATPTGSEQTLVIVLYGLSAALFSGAIASFYALMTHGYPASCRSAGIGFGIFVGRVGAIAATGLGGWLIDLGGGSLLPFFGVLCVGAVLISAAALVNDRHVPPARKTRGTPMN
ncbi:MFS transporter [Altererythrobacter salegens]|uniref:MFS transporter n=1 Tax=Croceibacterium salegens TaxID=1737568 RepID=A0A6I4SZL3_9SPHN|nr:MFS transporter [Croceibacterium salegens]MXO61313.1 MFS transporter [Croceibacterium salegens]